MLKRGIVRAFDPTTYRAQVQVEGSAGLWVEDVPVSRSIPAAEMVAGRWCIIAIFDITHPTDGAVVGILTTLG
ncbi:MAG: hypothetical protein ACK4K2_07350 [Dehalococcoidia bacterium]